MTITGGPPRTTAPARTLHDTTRTIAVVALVVSGVALLGQLVSGLVPLVAFGAFGLFDPGFEDSGGYVSETGSSFSVPFPAYSGDAVSGQEAAAAVAATEPFLGRPVRCEDAEPVRPGMMMACRTLDEPRTYLVVELDGAGHGDLRWFAPDSVVAAED